MLERTAAVLRIAALTHLGRRRYANEDCIAVGEWSTQEPSLDPRVVDLALDQVRLCVVADGMGGHPAGDVASRIAIRELCGSLPSAFGDEQRIRQCVVDANAAIFHEQRRHREYEGMGTTVAGIVLDHSSAFVLGVGDSRVYRIEGSRLLQLTDDDAQTVAIPFLGFELPMRSLSQCLGGFPGAEPVRPQVLRQNVAPGAAWLICSDGLHDMLEPEQMEACVSAEPVAMVIDLFDRAMDAGGHDNISIIIAQVRAAPDDGDPSIGPASQERA